MLAGVVFLACICAAWRHRSDPVALILLGLVAAAALLFWLGTYTRGDHWKWFFPAIALLPFVLSVHEKLQRDDVLRRTAVAITVAATLVVFRVVSPVLSDEFVFRIQNSVRNLAHLGDCWQATRVRPSRSSDCRKSRPRRWRPRRFDEIERACDRQRAQLRASPVVRASGFSRRRWPA
jgi:hypothetical protein